MRNMYRVLAFWTAIFAVMFFIGDMFPAALIFLCLTGFFLAIGFMNISERMSAYIFGAFLMVFFVGYTYYTTFLMPLGGPGH